MSEATKPADRIARLQDLKVKLKRVTKELARRLHPTRITSKCFIPTHDIVIAMVYLQRVRKTVFQPVRKCLAETGKFKEIDPEQTPCNKKSFY